MFAVKHFGKPSVFNMCYRNKVDWIGLDSRDVENGACFKKKKKMMCNKE